MSTVQIHPHRIIADFVNQYKQVIRPYLAEGKVDIALKSVIRNLFAYFERYDASSYKESVFGRYRSALGVLNGIMGTDLQDSRVIRSFIPNLDRLVEEMGFLLMEDDNFRSQRQREWDIDEKQNRR